MKNLIIRLLLFSLFSLFLFSSVLVAQNPEEEIHGFVVWENPDPDAETVTVPLEGVMVHYMDGSAHAYTDEDGHFELPPPQGEYPVQIMAMPEGFRHRTVTLQGPRHLTIRVWKTDEEAPTEEELREANTQEPPQQKSVKVQVMAYPLEGETLGEELEPLPGAAVYWTQTPDGAVSNSEGHAILEMPERFPDTLVARITGYRADTFPVTMPTDVQLVLYPLSVATIEIEGRQRSTTISSLSTIKTERIGERELTQAACCNLSESFENNPTVDVSYSDAVTGAKEIQVLGLAGRYTQLLTGNMPRFRSIGRMLGLNFYPGPWIESISVSKGVGSVRNGYEAMTGQINVEPWRASSGDRLYLNLYGNNFGRGEVNLVARQPLGNDWHANLMLHTSARRGELDQNNDDFQDLPEYEQVNVMHTWQNVRDDNTNTQFGLHYVFEDRYGGQTSFNHEESRLAQPARFGVGLRTRRIEGFAKSGHRLNAEKDWQTIGFQANFSNHFSDGFFGGRTYLGEEQQGYLNVLYTSIIGNTNHSFTTGPSFLYNNYEERFGETALSREELVPGAFFEYAYTAPKWTLVTGMRVDQHNLYGTFLSPRLHTKFDLSENTQLRLGGGRGYRLPAVFAENSNVMASNRQVLLPENPEPEIAWNYGLNMVHNFSLPWGWTGYISADAYRTDFERQFVADRDVSATQAVFRNNEGSSFSNAAQVELLLEPLEYLSLKTAYKFSDVQMKMGGELQQRPLTPQNRALFNLVYDRPKWTVSVTAHWLDEQRLPTTRNSPEELQQPEYTSAYWHLIGQASYRFGEKLKWEIYVGGENLNGFQIPDAVVSSQNPTSPFFDAGRVWGPVYGPLGYAGLRLRIK